MAEWPDPVGDFAGRAVGDAGFPEMTVGRAEAAFDLAGAMAPKASKNRVQTSRGVPSWAMNSSGIPGSRS
jgi:hypothetical protein